MDIGAAVSDPAPVTAIQTHANGSADCVAVVRVRRRQPPEIIDIGDFLMAIEEQQAIRNRINEEHPLNFGSEQKAKNEYRNQDPLENAS